MTNYIQKYQTNNNFNCPYCLEEKNIGSIRNNKFVINPKFWNFQILTCGHVICNDCYFQHADKIHNCASCREKTKVYQFKFNQTSYDEYDKSWKTLAEWFCQFNINLMRIKLNDWDPDYNTWTGYYARIRDYSLSIIRKEQQKIKQQKLKIKKEKDKYNFKLKKELNKIVPNRVLAKGEINKFIKKAKANIDSNSGSYICQYCSKNIPSKHRINHQKKCKKKLS